MVSLLIFAMIAAAGVAILTFSIRSQASTGARLDDIGALNRTMAILSADLAQATDRPTRDERGTTRPAFVGEGNSAATPMLRFVREGWSNLDGAARASAQKVEYRVEGGAFQRLAYPMLDGSPPMAPAILLTHVAQVALRYRIDGAWSDRWDGSGVAPLPQAMEVRLQRDDGTVFRQMFVVGTGYAPLPEGTPNGAG